MSFLLILSLSIFFIAEGIHHVVATFLGIVKFKKIDELRMPHPFLSYTNRREKGNVFRIDENGLIRNKILMPKPMNEIRIFALGDSTTECDMEPGWTTYLEKLLSPSHNEKIFRVYNFGVAGWCTVHSIINYLFYARDYEPDIIIFYHAWNDFYRSFYNKNNRVLSEYYDDYAHYIEGKISWSKFFPYSHRPNLAIQYINHLLAPYWFSDFLVHKPEPSDEFDIPSLDTFRRNLQIAIDIFKMDGGKVILITQPSLYKAKMTEKEKEKCWTNKVFFVSEDGKYYASNRFIYEGAKKFNDVIRRTAKSNNTALVDFANEITPSLDFFADDSHLTPRGNEILANCLKASILTIVDNR